MNKNSLWGGKGGRTFQTEVTAGIKAQRHESDYFMSAVCVYVSARVLTPVV